MKRAGIVHTNLDFFHYENIFVHLNKLHQSILRKKPVKKVYDVMIVRFESPKQLRAQKTLFKIKNTHPTGKLTV